MSRLPLWLLPTLPGFALYLGFYLPSLFIIVALSFQTYVPGRMPLPVFTLDNFVRFLADPFYLGLLLDTARISVISCGIAVVVAYPLAYFLVRSANLRRIIVPVLAMSFFISSIIRLNGWLAILSRGGPLNNALLALGVISEPLSLRNTEIAVIIGLADSLVPYAALALAGSIWNVDRRLEEAAQSLGATQWQTMLRVTLPLTFPGLLAASILTFALAVTAAVTPELLGGGRVPMLGQQVLQSMLVTLNYPFASASIVVMTLSVFLLTSLARHALKPRVA